MILDRMCLQRFAFNPQFIFERACCEEEVLHSFYMAQQHYKIQVVWPTVKMEWDEKRRRVQITCEYYREGTL